MYVSKNLRIILVWLMVDLNIYYISKFLFGHVSYQAYMLQQQV